MVGDTISSQPTSLYLFLEKYKCKENRESTHTRIPNRDLNIYAGSYSIPEDTIELFKKLYCEKVFQNKQQEYLTEKQLPTSGPILIDLDFRYKIDIEVRQHDDTYLEDIMELYLRMLKKVVKIGDDMQTFPIFALEKPHVNNLEDVTKDGIHIVIGVDLHHEAQIALREYVFIISLFSVEMMDSVAMASDAMVDLRALSSFMVIAKSGSIIVALGYID